MSPITTHILDTSKGLPAKGMNVVLYQQENNNWKEVGKGTTNDDGRATDLLQGETQISFGVYKLKFDTKSYFEELSVQAFYPFVEIVFEVKDHRHHHVPLLLNPYGYSTYRGS